MTASLLSMSDEGEILGRETLEREIPATLSLAQSLIACPSVTPSDGGAFDLICERLIPAGFVAERFDRNDTRNLWLKRGTASPLFCFAGHVDVVPPGDLAAWTSPPFSPQVRDGFLYGRGAADMKSSIAAMIVAVERFLAANPENPEAPDSIAFLLTSDEEGDARDGTIAVVEALGNRQETIDYCLIGEPTSGKRLGDTLKIGRRGSLSGKLRAHGTQCHIAYPEQGSNPIHRLAPALAELATTQWDEGDARFQPTSWQVSNIHAGTGANNVIPAFAEILFNFRFSPASNPHDLQARLNSILDRHGLQYEIQWNLSALPFLTEPGKLAHTAREAIREQTGEDAVFSTTGGTSDGRFLRAICREMIELGPENDTSHKVDEHIALASLTRLTLIYQSLLQRIFTRA